ncbi:hypothetical protein LINGRAHAP2_LOCUS4344 [Linum grandiflorum]
MIRGWATEPMLDELENTLANHETLDKQMSKMKVTVKDEEEETLFSKKTSVGHQRRARQRCDDEKEKIQRRKPKSKWEKEGAYMSLDEDI